MSGEGRVARRLGLEPQEMPLFFLMAALVTVLLCAYTIAKVVRDALFLQEFGALALPAGYVAVAFASAGFVLLNGRLVRRFSSATAARFTQYAVIGFGILAAASLPHAKHWTAAAFYLWSGSQALMLIPHFWGLALDVWDSRRARKLFPVFSGCGLVGGLAGGGISAALAPSVGRTGLTWIMCALFVASAVLTEAVRRQSDRSKARPGLAAALSSWEIFKQSNYIKVMTLGLALSVVVGTLVDFQFKLLIQRMYPDVHHLTQFLGTFYIGLNAVALLLQFGAAGWFLQKFGLSASTVLQPGAVLLFAAGAGFSTGGWGVIALRWVQGVISQTLGKSSSEIYYAAIHPLERRRIKPAIDTLAERWSDALAGVGLLIALRLLRVPMGAIIAATGVLAAVWLVVLFFLDRLYARAFHESLSRRWIEPESSPDSIRMPAARQALVAAVKSDDVRQAILALRLAAQARDPETAQAVKGALSHKAASVRAAALETMAARRLTDADGVATGLLADADESVRRAAVRYLLAHSPNALDLARGWLRGDDDALRAHLLDALVDHPLPARRVLDSSFVDARLASGRREDALMAARALGAMDGPGAVKRLRDLLTHSDIEIRRAAVVSAARRPSAELLDVLFPLLWGGDASEEARDAIAAIGDPAIPELTRALSGELGVRAQERAGRTLAQIASPRAAAPLADLVRNSDERLRFVGLKGLARIRVRSGRKTLPRSAVHRMFLRELREYRKWHEPVAELDKHAEPSVRLLGESYRESAERALERALFALATWYDPRPLIGVFDGLKSRDAAAAAPALEYLGHVLPRRVFRPVSTIFEKEPMDSPEQEPGADAARLAQRIQSAWDTGDAWLRACAVRASRCSPGFDPAAFGSGDGVEPIVRMELDALAAAGGPRC